jgi:hypothetical protein
MQQEDKINEVKGKIIPKHQGETTDDIREKGERG